MRILTLAQSRREARCACGSRRSSTSRSRKARTKASDKIRDETVGSTLLFQNPRNDFERGFAFAATSMPNRRPRPSARASSAGRGATSTRRRWSRPAAPTARPRDDGRRVAAFCGEIDARAGRRNEDRHRARPGAEPGAKRSPPPRAVDVARRPSGPRGDPRRLGRSARQGRGPDQPARLRSTGQHVAALSALRVAAVGPRRPEPARRRDRISRPVAGRAAADPARAAPGAGADRAAREPAVSRGRRAQMVASRPERRHGPRPAHQGERPASLAALCARALCPRRPATRACSTRSTPFLEGAGGSRARGHLDRHSARLARNRDRLRACAARDRLHAAASRPERPAAAAAPATGTTASTCSAGATSAPACGWGSSWPTSSTASSRSRG